MLQTLSVFTCCGVNIETDSLTDQMSAVPVSSSPVKLSWLTGCFANHPVRAMQSSNWLLYWGTIKTIKWQELQRIQTDIQSDHLTCGFSLSKLGEWCLCSAGELICIPVHPLRTQQHFLHHDMLSRSLCALGNMSKVSDAFCPETILTFGVSHICCPEVNRSSGPQQARSSVPQTSLDYGLFGYNDGGGALFECLLQCASNALPYRLPC